MIFSKCPVGTNSMLPDFMEEENAWTIVTQSTANYLIKIMHDLCFSEIEDAPPERTAYLLLHKTPMPWVQEAVDKFTAEIIQKIAATPELTFLYQMDEERP